MSNPLAPRTNNKLPFWKQPLTIPLVLWLLLHVVLTAGLWQFFITAAIEDGEMVARDTGKASLFLLVSFATVVFCLAVVRKLGELALRPFRRGQ